MRMSNVMMLAVALVCAVLAALLSRAWLASQPSAPKAAASSRAIVVAARDLKPGDKLNKAALRTMPWAGETLPKGAFLSVSPLVKPGAPRTVQAPIAENEPVLEYKLTGTAQNPLAAKMGESMNAVTIRVNDVAGVAGFVQPGDYVDVFLTYSEKATDSGAPVKSKPGIVVLLQSVRVLAVDQMTERKAKTSPPKAVTVEVTTEDAQKLILAGNVGQLSLALKRVQDSKGKTRPVSAADFLPGEGQLKAPGNSSADSPGGPVVTVTRAVERKQYRVTPEPQSGAGWRHEYLRH